MILKIEAQIPDFYIVGAAKSGTTSLWYYLGQHPNVYMTKEIGVKELSFFCDDYGIKTLSEYSSYFNLAKPNQLIGEVCHTYLTSSESAKLIKRHNPNAKIVIVLRNPVDRAYSLYNWMVAEGYEFATTFEKALKLENQRISDPDFKTNSNYPTYFRNYHYFSSGLYSEQVRLYLEVFGKDNCHIISFDELRISLSSVLEELLNFLGLRSDYVYNREVQNISKTVKSPRLQYFLYRKFLYITSYFLPEKIAVPIRNKLIKINTSSKLPLKMKKQTRENLQLAYKDDIQILEKLIDKDLSSWYQIKN